MKRIPALGIVGVLALREAAASEYRQVTGLVRAALEATLKAAAASPSDLCCNVIIEAMYADRVIVCRQGRYWAYPYTIDESNQVQIGAKAEVIENYVPVTALREALDASTVPDGQFVEAADDGKGLVYEAVLIRSGLSKNNRFYPDAVLREAVSLFEGRPIFAKGDVQHLKGEGKDVRNIVGYVADAKFVEGKTADTGYLQGTVTFLAASGTLPETIREAWNRGKKDLVGLSIDATGKAKAEKRGGATVKVATSISKVDSVDLIVEPGAGGGLVRLVEAAATTSLQENSDMSLKQKMYDTIKAKAPAKAAAINLDTVTDDELEQHYREALAIQPKNEPADLDEVNERIRMIEARANARAKINAAALPQPAKDKLLKQFETRERFVEADVDAQIKEERDYLARFTESGHVRMTGLDVETTEPRSTKIAAMLDAFFDPSHKDHRSVQSFRECYREITGDSRVTGRIEDCDMSRLREAAADENFRESMTTATFANVLGNSLNRRMVADYRDMGQYDVWRPLVDIVPINDFRTQERVRFGGYGNLPAVAQGGAYTALNSPTDEKAAYAVGKYGGTEDLTMEMIRNDDVGSIRRIPTRMSRAAKMTLGQFVLDFLRTNPTIYDGVALFHASHNNLGAAALDATSLAARRLAMLKQAEAGSAQRLAIGPKYLVVPVDLQQAATDLFNRNTNLDKTFVQDLSLQVLPVWYWADTNDWVLSADPADIPTIELGFLDGDQEPALFVQDLPNVGSMFSNDKLTYKIRHIYGGTVADYRGLDKSVVP